MGAGFRTYGGGGHFQMGGMLTPAIKALLIANVSVFVVHHLFVTWIWGPGGMMGFARWFGLVPAETIFGLRIWQPFTYLFLHGDLWHLLINLFVLWMFGSDLERAWGPRRFFKYFLVTGIGAGVLNIVVKLGWALFSSSPAATVGLQIPTIGASGAVYGVLLAAALFFPSRQVFLFPFPIMIPMKIYVIVIGAIAFYGSLRAPGDGISHITHLGGMLVGYFYLRRGSFFFGVRNRYADWRRRRLRRKFELYMRRKQGRPPRPPDDWVN
jgi:membrane associated rhomboid family serine protease